MDSWMQVHLLSKLARRENAASYERGDVPNVSKGEAVRKSDSNIVALLKERTCRERQRYAGSSEKDSHLLEHRRRRRVENG